MRHRLSLVGLSVGMVLAVACSQETEPNNGSQAQSSAVEEEQAAPAPPGPPGPPPEAIAACIDLEDEASCTVSLGERTIEGTCRKGPGPDDEVACAPNDRPPPPPPPPPRKPPKEAFDACEGMTVEASCTVTLGERTIEGTCRKGPGADDELACAPNDRPPHAPPPPPRKPPNEAFDACEGKTAEASCTVTLGERAIEGTCRKGPDDKVACAPNDRPPPPRPPKPPKEAFDACEGMTVDASCTVTLGERAIEGTCHMGPDDKVACAPNDRPPPPPPHH